MSGCALARLALIAMLFVPACTNARVRLRTDAFRDWQAVTHRVSSLATLLELHHEHSGCYFVTAPTQVSSELLSTLRGRVKTPLSHLELRTHDVWGNALWIASDGGHYVVWSLGADGRVDPSWSGADLPFSPADDIVLVDGNYIHYHAGLANVVDGRELQTLVAIAEHLAGSAGPLGCIHPPPGACWLTPGSTGLAALAG